MTHDIDHIPVSVRLPVTHYYQIDQNCTVSIVLVDNTILILVWLVKIWWIM